MRKKTTYFLSVLCLLFFLIGCTVNKNTAFRRNYHALNTTYNVYFNANEAFKRGYKNVENSYQPDYSNIIDMYAISDKSTVGVATGDMARTVEKCEKAIKEHSIRKKPKRNPKKARDPKYQAFYNKEEFNPKMDDVWMLMAKAKFYSNEYLAASATFTYVINHFSEDKLLVAEASIWKARCFKEMDWTYEAEDLMKKVSDDRFTRKQNNLYAGAYADLLIHKGELAEALPYLKTAIATEKSKKLRTRFTFIAGQIYQELGQKENAYAMYDKVISSNPAYQMAFNARIRQTEVYTGDTKKDMIKTLGKMAKSSKNKDYLDQIYYAMGNIYLARKDTLKAIENYKLSVEKSVRNGLEKAQSYIAMGDLYYQRAEYLSAQPAYSEAAAIIDQTHPDYKRVSDLSAILDELATNYNTVVLQDSLQHLAQLPKQEQLEAINKVIQKIIADEQAEQKRQEEERLQNDRLDLEIQNMAIMDQRALGTNKQINFYFDNKSTVEKGKTEFLRKYGSRKLEDNWNRKDKTVVSISDESITENEEKEVNNELLGDTTKENLEAERDPKRVEYYLRQLPYTDEQVSVSNEQIADALFNMGVIYNEKLQDYPRAVEAFDEFVKRFPNDRRAADAYFYNYRIAGRLENESQANAYRDKLIAEYPDSKFAKILSQPDFRRKLERMQIEQDSLYELTYKEFLAGNFETVKINTAYMEENYPVSPLIPKFLLLDALGVGKSGDREAFSQSLNELLNRYPNSDVASMAKDILALMAQGKTPEAGTPGGLMALREEAAQPNKQDTENAQAQFSANENTPYLFTLITDPQTVDQNQLLFEIATYNFTKFLVKDFDIRMQNGQLIVSGLDNLEEALWYIKGILEDKSMQQLLHDTDYKYLIISEENYMLLNKGHSIEEYEQFYKENIADHQKKKSNKQPEIELIGQPDKAAENVIDQMNPSSQPAENGNQSAKDAVSQVPANQAAPKTPNPTAETAQNSIDQETYQAPKDLKKYKNLYTYDENSPHYFAILIPKGGADFETVKKVLDLYNNNSQPLLNLNVTADSGKNCAQIILTGVFTGSKIATSYLLQIVKNQELKDALKEFEYRNVVISHDNLKALKESGNGSAYMELFNRMYLNR